MLKNWFKKLAIPSGEKTTVIAYNSWTVRWYSSYGRHDSCIADRKPEAEIFPSQEDAEKYANQLREAFKLLRYDGSATKVTVESNQSKLATMQND